MDDVLHIEHRDDISVAEFAQTYLRSNQPVVLGASFTKEWNARREWVTSGRPNFARIREIYGTAIVPVAHCDTPHFNDQKRTEMPMSDFLDLWQSSGPEEKLYCKDFHLMKHAYEAYRVPPPLSDDWLNMFYDLHPQHDDDYRFCYMGGDGTWTPFHRDVYWSYSWSANICGTKRWILVPPGQEDLFTDGLGHIVYDLRCYDRKQFLRLGELRTVEIVQREGEIVFVPSQWWHQVHNVGDTISINHNWANEYNLPVLYRHLRSGIEEVHHAFRDLTDIDEFHTIAQQALRANSGMDYKWFFDFTATIADVYLDALSKIAVSEPPLLVRLDPYFSSPRSIKFALDRISMVLDLLLHDDVTRTVDGLAEQIATLHMRVKINCVAEKNKSCQ